MSSKLIGTVTGYVTADAEATADKVKFSIAINRGVKNKETGEWVEHAMWLRCTDFHVNRSSKLTKGALVQVTGEITWDERPEDKGGGKGCFYAPDLKVVDVSVVKWANNEEGKSGSREPAKARRRNDDNPFA